MDSSSTKAQPLILGALGRQISGKGCSAFDRLLYSDAWFQFGHAKPARFRPSFNRRSQANLEWPGGVGLSADARRPPATTRRVEQGGPPSEGLVRTYC